MTGCGRCGRSCGATPRPILVGGTGLYFRALTEGLAEIPAVPPEVPRRGRRDDATGALLAGLDQVDPSLAAADRPSEPRPCPAREWEVWRATGRPLRRLAGRDRRRRTPNLHPHTIPTYNPHHTPIFTPMPLDHAAAAGRPMPIVGLAETTGSRQRFDRMLEDGALEEARANPPRWERAGGARKAIGAARAGRVFCAATSRSTPPGTGRGGSPLRGNMPKAPAHVVSGADGRVAGDPAALNVGIRLLIIPKQCAAACGHGRVVPALQRPVPGQAPDRRMRGAWSICTASPGIGFTG